MNLQPTTNLASTRIPSMDSSAIGLPPQVSFAQVLAQPSIGLADQSSRSQQAYQAAQDVVATNFIQPILDQLQNDPFRAELFHGGQGEKIFQQQLNSQLAQRITAGAKLPVVDAVYRSIMKSPARAAGGLSQQA